MHRNLSDRHRRAPGIIVCSRIYCAPGVCYIPHRRPLARAAQAKAFAPLVAYCGIYWRYTVLILFNGHCLTQCITK